MGFPGQQHQPPLRTLFFKTFILAVLGPYGCAWAFLWLPRVGTTLHRGACASHRGGFFCGALVLGMQVAQGSIVVAYGLSYPTARGISPDQRSNLCALHGQADS